MGLTLGGASARDLILDGQSVSLYVGGNPPTKVWPTREVVQITLGTGYEARDQFRKALTARGLTYQGVTEIPFDIKLVGTGVADHLFDYCSNLTKVPALNTRNVTSMRYMFRDCRALKEAPAMDTRNVTDMTYLFNQCSSLTYVPDLHTAQVIPMTYMFFGCSALTDGNVRLIGRHPNASTGYMIYNSGLTREPFYVIPGVYEVTLTNVNGSDTVHPLLTVAVPAGETWAVTIEGTVTRAGSNPSVHPRFRIGTTTSGGYAEGDEVNIVGTISSADSTIAMVTGSSLSAGRSSFVGTVTIEK